MANKCGICGKKLGLMSKPIKLYGDDRVCRECWTRLGYTDADIEKYKYKSPVFLAKGKAAVEAEIAKADALREYTFKVVGVTFKQDGMDPQKVLKKYQAENCDPEWQYNGMTNAEIRDELTYDEKVYQYEPLPFTTMLEPTTHEGSDAIRVYMDTESDTGTVAIGWIAADQVETVKSLLSGKVEDITGAVTGGKYKYLSYPDDKVKTETDNFGATVTIQVLLQG